MKSEITIHSIKNPVFLKFLWFDNFLLQFLPNPIVNPLILTAAKSYLSILVKSFMQKHSWENISKNNINNNTTKFSFKEFLKSILIFK